jgi:hypothetical protein
MRSFQTSQESNSFQTSQESNEELIKRLLRKYEQTLRQNLTEGTQTLEEIEREVSKIGKQVQKDLQNERTEQKGTGYTQDRIPCSCGRMAAYAGEYRRQLLTLHGPVTLTRAYYYCQRCKTGWCPLDAVLGLDKGETSIGVRGLIGRLSAYMPDRKATTEAELLTGVKMAPSTAQRLSRAIGEQLVRDWEADEARLKADKLAGPDRCIPCLHTSMDGVFVYVDKQWREVKIGVVYERGENALEQKAYYATLAKSADFGQRWRVLTYVNGSGQCRKLVVVADGAEWIWQETGKYAPTSVQILDFYHAVEHLWVVARMRFGEGSKEAAEWISSQQERLLDDKVKEVIADIASWHPSTVAADEVREGKLNYLRHHQDRMRYKTFRDAGYHIGSGVVEASCKSTVQGRMKGAGMRWSEKGAEAMLHLRAAWCTSQQTDFAAIARRASMAA